MAILVNISYLNAGSVTREAVQAQQDNQVFTSLKYVAES